MNRPDTINIWCQARSAEKRSGQFTSSPKTNIGLYGLIKLNAVRSSIESQGFATFFILAKFDLERSHSRSPVSFGCESQPFKNVIFGKAPCNAFALLCPPGRVTLVQCVVLSGRIAREWRLSQQFSVSLPAGSNDSRGGHASHGLAHARHNRATGGLIARGCENDFARARYLSNGGFDPGDARYPAVW